jgi:hypothetical protein
MNRGVIFIAVLVVALGVGLFSGKGGAVKYNQTLVKGNERLAAAGQKIGEAVPPAMLGGEAEIAKLKKAHKDALDVLASIQSEMSTISVPSRDSGTKLHETYKQFLAGQDSMLKDVGKVIAIIEDATLNQQDKLAQIQTVLGTFEQRENADLQKLKEAQRAFAADYGFRLQ